MTEPVVVMHRPPLKRVDFSRPPRAPEPVEPEGVKALRELGERIEHERIWGHVTRTARGCNPGAVE